MCGSVMLKALRRSPASSGCSQRSFCSGVPASARISELPESGAALPNASGAIGEVPRISCISPRRTWPMPWPPSSGRQVGRPQAARLDLLLQRRERAAEPVDAQLVPDRLQRPDLAADEVRHPVELLLEVGVGGEVPAHASRPFGRARRWRLGQAYALRARRRAAPSRAPQSAGSHERPPRGATIDARLSPARHRRRFRRRPDARARGGRALLRRDARPAALGLHARSATSPSSRPAT